MTGPGGINASVVGVLLVICIWLLKVFIEKRQLSPVISRTIRPVSYFLISAVLSFIFGQLPWYVFAKQAPIDAQVGGLMIFLLSGAMFLAIPYVITDLKKLRRFTWLFLGLGGIYILGRAAGITLIDQIFQNGFIANSMFWTWMVALAFGQVLLNKELKPFWRLVLIGLLAVTAYVAYFINGDWKSGYIPALAAIAAIIGIRFPKLALLASPIAVIALIFVANQSIASEAYSWGTRLDAWTIVLDIAKVSPILGMGFGNYSFYTVIFPIRGYYNIRFNSHSQFVDLIAQTGIVGLIIFLWVILEVTWLGWTIKDKTNDGFSRGYVYGVMGGVAGSIVASFLVDWILPYIYNIGFNGFRASILPWIFFGGLVSVEQIIRNQSNNAEVSI